MSALIPIFRDEIINLKGIADSSSGKQSGEINSITIRLGNIEDAIKISENLKNTRELVVKHINENNSHLEKPELVTVDSKFDPILLP